MEPQGRQADEPEDGARAQGALEPVRGVVLDVGVDHRQHAVEEPAQSRGVHGQAFQRRLVRLLHDLGEHLGEDAGVGNADGQHPAHRVEADDRQEQEGPEDLVDGADEGAEQPDRGDLEEEGQNAAEGQAEGDAAEGEGDGVEEGFAEGVEDRQVGGQEAQGDAPQLPPGFECGDFQVGQDQADHGDADKLQTRSQHPRRSLRRVPAAELGLPRCGRGRRESPRRRRRPAGRRRGPLRAVRLCAGSGQGPG